jgi:hypothetical protein
MLKAHWRGYEIDSSEAAYEIKVPQPEKLGTLLRAFLGSGYFVRSYTLLSETSLVRLRDFVTAQGDATDKATAKVLEAIEKQVGKLNDRRYSTIGLRAVETILNYVGAQRQALLEAQTFRFELTEEQREMLEDYDVDEEFEPGSLVDESIYYSEMEIPWDGVAFALGCSLVGAGKLSEAERKKAHNLVKRRYREFDLLEEMEGWGFGFGESRDYVLESISHSQGLSLRVRLNPDATFAITGRWMDDGQFIFPYYEYLLGLAAKKAQARVGFSIL